MSDLTEYQLGEASVGPGKVKFQLIHLTDENTTWDSETRKPVDGFETILRVEMDEDSGIARIDITGFSLPSDGIKLIELFMKK